MTKEQLEKYDFILCVDKSTSMGTRDMSGGRTRWQAAQEATLGIARKCEEYDKDGITVIPFNNGFKEYPNVKGGEAVVENIFKENEPNGSTDTAKVLGHVFDKYFTNPTKPIIVLVVTDGIPDDQQALSDVIIKATKRMDKDEQIGVSFLQIGQDQRASEYLKALDDGLQAKGAKFDIVDTKTFEEMGNMPITDVLIAALTD